MVHLSGISILVANATLYTHRKRFQRTILSLAGRRTAASTGTAIEAKASKDCLVRRASYRITGLGLNSCAAASQLHVCDASFLSSQGIGFNHHAHQALEIHLGIPVQGAPSQAGIATQIMNLAGAEEFRIHFDEIG